MPLVTSDQIRAGRALLDISQAELTRRARVTLGTVCRIERPAVPISGQVSTISRIIEALEDNGIVFTRHGVELERDAQREHSPA